MKFAVSSFVLWLSCFSVPCARCQPNNVPSLFEKMIQLQTRNDNVEEKPDPEDNGDTVAVEKESSSFLGGFSHFLPRASQTVVSGSLSEVITVAGSTCAEDSGGVYCGGVEAYFFTVEGSQGLPQYSLTSMECTARQNNPLVFFQLSLNKGSQTNGQTDDCVGELATTGASTCSVDSLETCGENVYWSIGAGSVATSCTSCNTCFCTGSSTISLDCSYEICDECETAWGVEECFSGEDTVYVHGKGSTLMKDLRVGEKILVGDAYESVYGFAHLDKNKESKFLQIYTTEANKMGPLEVTGNHLLLVNDEYMPAKFLQVGDALRGEHGAVVVTEIKSIYRTGLYAPLTPSGTLLVGGVVVSAYVSVQKGSPKHIEFQTNGGANQMIDLLPFQPLSHHTISHMAMTPIRMACMGISSSLCSNDFINAKTGYPIYVKFWFDLVNMFDEQSFSVQFFLLVLFVLVCGPLCVLECIFGPSLSPTVMALAITAGVTYKRGHVHGLTFLKKKQN